MKLISKLRDFYDFAIHQHGVDPLLVWKRKPEPIGEMEMRKLLDVPFYRNREPFGNHYRAAYLILNDRVFIYAYTINKDRLGIAFDYPFRFQFHDAAKVFYETRGRYDRSSKWEEFVAEVTARYGKLTDLTGHPIVGYVPQPDHLCYEHKCSHRISSSDWWTNPLLAQLPITKDLSGQQVYEEILKFFCRTAQPKDPAPQPEDTRIEAQGFCLKTSFRHRKK